MLIARLAVAACALLVLVGCGIGHSSEAVRQPTRTATPTAAAERSDYRASDGSRKSIGDGVVLTISPPKSFTPTDTAYPRSTRAVAFEMTIDNGGALAYRPATMSFTATIDGARTAQIIDSTQGYTGTAAAAEEIAPSGTLRLAIAFAVAAEPCQMRVAVRPATATSTSILLYDGTV